MQLASLVAAVTKVCVRASTAVTTIESRSPLGMWPVPLQSQPMGPASSFLVPAESLAQSFNIQYMVNRAHAWY